MTDPQCGTARDVTPIQAAILAKLSIPPALVPQDLQQCCDAGMNKAQASRHLGITVYRATKLSEAQGVPFRDVGTHRRKFCELTALGASTPQIASILGIKPQSVRRMRWEAARAAHLLLDDRSARGGSSDGRA